MRGPSCSSCPAPAVHFARYSGRHLCRDHFLRFVEKRVQRELSAAGRMPRGSRLAVGVSGGKDSTVCLRLVHRILRGSGVEVVAVTVDEGIAGYRPEGLKVAAATCEELGVEHHVVSYRETVGFEMDEVHELKMAGITAGGAEHRPRLRLAPQTECSYCGVFRRDALNQAAREVGAARLATGHNLDDVAQTVLMNLLGGDLEKLGRLAPHEKPREGMVPRVLPLRSIPENEVYLTAMLEGWTFHDGECPYAVNAQRNRFRDMLAALEAETPGTRHTLLKVGDEIKGLLGLRGIDARPGPVGTCDRCGEPTNGGACKKCQLVALLAATAGGADA